MFPFGQKRASPRKMGIGRRCCGKLKILGAALQADGGNEVTLWRIFLTLDELQKSAVNIESHAAYEYRWQRYSTCTVAAHTPASTIRMHRVNAARRWRTWRLSGGCLSGARRSRYPSRLGCGHFDRCNQCCDHSW